MEGGDGTEKVTVGNSSRNDDQNDSLTAEVIQQTRFKSVLAKAFEKRANKCYDFDAFILTSYILEMNSDFHVMWNFRREILLYWKENGNPNRNDTKALKENREYFGDFDDYDFFQILGLVELALSADKIVFDDICQTELTFTRNCLNNHLKSYATWHHRTLIVKWMDNPPLEDELRTCKAFFDLDPRNFHCWNYRKFICERLYGSDGFVNQINFIKTIIKKHPDNFSAFHYKSDLVMKANENERLMFTEDPIHQKVFQKVWDDEFNSIQSSLISEGLWLYFWWLCLMKNDSLENQSSKSKSKTKVYRVIFDRKNHIIIYQFNHFLRKKPFDEVTILVNGVSSIIQISEWYSTGTITSDIWYHKVDDISCDHPFEIIFTFCGETFYIKMKPPSNQSNLAVNTLDELPKYRFDLISKTDALSWVDKILEESRNPTAQVGLKSFNCINIVERVRYYNLTRALLYDENFDVYLEKLIQMDPLRRNFYRDFKSRHIIERKLNDSKEDHHLDLKNLSLTCVHPISQLTHLRSLDLSNNNLTRINSSFNSLVSLESLILDNNQITRIEPTFKMFSLETLSLKKNRLTDKSSIRACSNCEQLKTIIISENVIATLNIELDKKINIII